MPEPSGRKAGCAHIGGVLALIDGGGTGGGASLRSPLHLALLFAQAGGHFLPSGSSHTHRRLELEELWTGLRRLPALPLEPGLSGEVLNCGFCDGDSSISLSSMSESFMARASGPLACRLPLVQSEALVGVGGLGGRPGSVMTASSASSGRSRDGRLFSDLLIMSARWDSASRNMVELLSLHRRSYSCHERFGSRWRAAVYSAVAWLRRFLDRRTIMQAVMMAMTSTAAPIIELTTIRGRKSWENDSVSVAAASVVATDGEPEADGGFEIGLATSRLPRSPRSPGTLTIMLQV